LQKVRKRYFIILRVIGARGYASYINYAIDAIFLEEGKKITEWVSGMPYGINYGTVHYTIY
jgi:hypothetical protein